ncbi:calcium/sodium antiporter [Nisaea sp.]|uniref:calcium/sodium antiporter n=1 Tax=Nisaea sp. TaxID=2024842 RepID=UPI003B529DDD
MIWLELALGLALLLAGGEFLVRGSVGVALRLGVSPLLIGLTLVGFGTSTPELVASLEAALIGAPGIAVGNIVGSNIANILLILGASAVILPIATTRRSFGRDGSVLIGASLLLLVVTMMGELGRFAGLALIALLAVYTLYTYRSERRSGLAAEPSLSEIAAAPSGQMTLRFGLMLAAAGIGGVVWGASLLVGASIEIARAAGLSETVIGLTLVAVGTSLPELVTSATAAVRRQGDVAFGNIVGSNIFNILGIGGVTAAVTPIDIPTQIGTLDIWAMLGAAVLLVLFAVTNWRVSRGEGAVFLALYALYLAVQFHPGLRAAAGLV